MKKMFTGIALVILATLTSTNVMAQAQAQAPATVEIEPTELELKVGESAQLTGIVKDEIGNVIPDAQVLFFGSRINLTVTPGGYVTAIRPGEHRVVALSPEERIEDDPDYYTRSFEAGIRGRLEITVPEPAPPQMLWRRRRLRSRSSRLNWNSQLAKVLNSREL